MSEPRTETLREALDKAGDWIISQPTPAVFQPEKDAVLAAIDVALSASPSQPEPLNVRVPTLRFALEGLLVETKRKYRTRISTHAQVVARAALDGLRAVPESIEAVRVALSEAAEKETPRSCNHFPGQTECDWCRPAAVPGEPEEEGT